MTQPKRWPTAEQAIAKLAPGLRVLPYPRNPAYLVCEDGRIMNYRKTAWLRPCTLKRGEYLGVNLWVDGKGKTIAVHRVVAITFHGEPPTPKHDAAHGDSNKKNNHESNLSWKTRKENEADKVPIGLANIGDRNGMAILAEEQIPQIRLEIAALPRSSGAGLRIKKGAIAALAEKYGVTADCLRAVAAGKLWRHINAA